jgi:hypothetical protein
MECAQRGHMCNLSVPKPVSSEHALTALGGRHFERVMPRVLSGWPPPKWPIPLLWSSGAQFKVDGIDLDALHAKAKATSVDGHRRALQMSEGGCTDTKFFVEGLTLALNQAGAEILDITSFMEEFANNLTVPEDVGSGKAEDFGSGEAEDFGSGEAGNELSNSYPPQRRKLRAQINNKL